MKRFLVVLLATAGLTLGPTALPANAACTTYRNKATAKVAVQNIDGEIDRELDRLQTQVYTCGTYVEKVRVVAWGSPERGGLFDCAYLDGLWVNLDSVGGVNPPRFWLDCQRRGMGRTIYIARRSSDQCYSGVATWKRLRGPDLSGWGFNAARVCG